MKKQYKSLKRQNGQIYFITNGGKDYEVIDDDIKNMSMRAMAKLTNGIIKAFKLA